MCHNRPVVTLQNLPRFQGFACVRTPVQNVRSRDRQRASATTAFGSGAVVRCNPPRTAVSYVDHRRDRERDCGHRPPPHRTFELWWSSARVRRAGRIAAEVSEMDAFAVQDDASSLAGRYKCRLCSRPTHSSSRNCRASQMRDNSGLPMPYLRGNGAMLRQLLDDLTVFS